MKRGVIIAAVVAVLSAVGWAAATVYTASEFTCLCDDTSTAGHRDGLCWLDDYRLRNKAVWTFSGVPQGVELTLRLTGTAEEICDGNCVGRELMVWLFYGTGQGDWNRMELVLKSQSTECSPDRYEVAGEASFVWYAPVPEAKLVIMAKRVGICDPHVGFDITSLTLWEKEAPPPPPPEEPEEIVEETPAPPAPPPPEPEACLDEMGFSCAPAEVARKCASGVDLEAVNRTPLPDTSGPISDTIQLEPGHYLGSLGPGDYHDWYRFQVGFDQGAVVYVKAFGDLVMDVYIVHDPCGTVLAMCKDVTNDTALVLPCYEASSRESLAEGKEKVCYRLPGGDDTCFLNGACTLLVHLVRRQGSGEYYLSIIPAARPPK